MFDLKRHLTTLIEKRFGEEGYFVVDIKLLPNNKLQIFIDGDNGITINKCAEISRYLKPVLDAEPSVNDNYILEVSSPGVDNPLKVLRQYKRHIGKKVYIILKDGTKKQGLLTAVDDEKITLAISMDADGELNKKNKKIVKNTNDLTPNFDFAFKEIKTTKLSFSF